MEKIKTDEFSNKELSEHISLDKKHIVLDKITIGSIIVIVILGAFLYFKPGIKTGDQIFKEVNPAVVRIGVRLGGTITVPDLQDFSLNKNGDLVAGNKTASYPITTVLLGTGFVVNSKGYVVTNAHVVDISDESVKNEVFSEFAFENLALLKKSFPDSNEDVISKIFKQIFTIYINKGRIDDLTWKIAVFDPSKKQGTIEEYIDQGFQILGVKKMGEPYPNLGKDLAIIKIDRSEAWPTVTLGDSDKVKQGSKVYVIGYPGVADLNDSGNIEPTLTSGIVSAIRKSSQGDYNVIQIDAAIAGGNSGGPALNEKGEVIGVATFGSDDTQGYNWILPISLAKEFLDELNVKY